MEKRQINLYKKKRLYSDIAEISIDNINLIYWSWDFSLSNIYHNPLLLITKINGVIESFFYNFKKLGLLPKAERPPFWVRVIKAYCDIRTIEHVCYINRYNYDYELAAYLPQIYEATTHNGVEENDLIGRLKNFKGTCWIETIDCILDEDIERGIRTDTEGMTYGYLEAGLAGYDFNNESKLNSGKAFCSFLTYETLIRYNILGLDKTLNSLELTPIDIYRFSLGKKKVLHSNSNENY